VPNAKDYTTLLKIAAAAARNANPNVKVVGGSLAYSDAKFLEKMYLNGDWNHIVGVRDIVKDSLYVYLNGVLVGSIKDVTELDIASPLPLIIGSNFKGKVDETMIYNKALSADEIAAMASDYNITAKSSDATLSDLLVDGTTITDFASDQLTYTVQLPEGTTTVPTVTYATSSDKASAILNNTSALPGNTTVIVTAEDGSVKSYLIEFTLITGINDAKYSDLRVYPNPANDYIVFNSTEQSIVSIYTIEGKKVMEKLVKANGSINIQELTSGQYIAKVKIGNNERTLRFMKK
jgi:hypothetical protein